MKFYQNVSYHDLIWKDFMVDAINHIELDGLTLEFGVASGDSAAFICKYLNGKELHGFDWFMGLPESWHGWPVGYFSTSGQCPIKHKNLKIFNGLFANTLPKYLEDYKGQFAFVHVDCDLYSSTKTIFDLCHDRILTGTILVFDEILWHKNYMEHEGLAFIEFTRTYNKDYEVLGITSDGQMSVRIK